LSNATDALSETSAGTAVPGAPVCLRAVPPVAADAGGRLVALDGPPPGDEVLRDGYETVTSSTKPRNATGWVEPFRTS
jgi:hypothetical protein